MNRPLIMLTSVIPQTYLQRHPQNLTRIQNSPYSVPDMSITDDDNHPVRQVKMTVWATASFYTILLWIYIFKGALISILCRAREHISSSPHDEIQHITCAEIHAGSNSLRWPECKDTQGEKKDIKEGKWNGLYEFSPILTWILLMLTSYI